MLQLTIHKATLELENIVGFSPSILVRERGTYFLGILNFLHKTSMFLDARNAKRLRLRADGIDEVVKRYRG
jgi:hypothetical protein